VREKPFSYFPGIILAAVNVAVKARLKKSPDNGYQEEIDSHGEVDS
jgi:hypothetical protein